MSNIVRDAVLAAVVAAVCLLIATPARCAWPPNTGDVLCTQGDLPKKCNDPQWRDLPQCQDAEKFMDPPATKIRVKDGWVSFMWNGNAYGRCACDCAINYESKR